MHDQARRLSISLAFVSSLLCFGCGGSQGTSNSALAQGPLVCDTGWAHPIQCETVGPDGKTPVLMGGSGDRFAPCAPGQTTHVDESTCCQTGVENPPCITSSVPSGPPTVPVAGATVP